MNFPTGHFSGTDLFRKPVIFENDNSTKNSFSTENVQGMSHNNPNSTLFQNSSNFAKYVKFWFLCYFEGKLLLNVYLV